MGGKPPRSYDISLDDVAFKLSTVRQCLAVYSAIVL